MQIFLSYQIKLPLSQRAIFVALVIGDKFISRNKSGLILISQVLLEKLTREGRETADCNRDRWAKNRQNLFWGQLRSPE